MKVTPIATNTTMSFTLIQSMVITMSTVNDIHIARLLQFSDSACPIGSFAFSCGLESAAACNLVYDTDTLKDFVQSNALQSAFCDSIAALHAHRATVTNDYDGIIKADNALIMSKMNDEARAMLTKTGRKLLELGKGLTECDVFNRLLADIRNGSTHGTYPIAQGVTFAVHGIDERELFLSHQYGVINMVLSAALRCVRVSHIDTQKILYSLMGDMPALFEEVKHMSLDEMHAFCPQLDIMASLHEKGTQRMFMS